MMVVNQPTSPREFLQPYKKQHILLLAIIMDLYSCRCFPLLSLLHRYISVSALLLFYLTNTVSICVIFLSIFYFYRQFVFDAVIMFLVVISFLLNTK